MLTAAFSVNYDYITYAVSLVNEVASFLQELRTNELNGGPKEVKNRIKGII